VVGTHDVTRGDVVVADANGVLFLPEDRLDDIVAAATAVRDTERQHVEAMETGRSFRAQVRFGEYLSRRARDAGYRFRQHLEDIQAAGEA